MHMTPIQQINSGCNKYISFEVPCKLGNMKIKGFHSVKYKLFALF